MVDGGRRRGDAPVPLWPRWRPFRRGRWRAAEGGRPRSEEAIRREGPAVRQGPDIAGGRRGSGVSWRVSRVPAVVQGERAETDAERVCVWLRVENCPVGQHEHPSVWPHHGSNGRWSTHSPELARTSESVRCGHSSLPIVPKGERHDNRQDPGRNRRLVGQERRRMQRRGHGENSVEAERGGGLEAPTGPHRVRRVSGPSQDIRQLRERRAGGAACRRPLGVPCAATARPRARDGYRRRRQDGRHRRGDAREDG